MIPLHRNLSTRVRLSRGTRSIDAFGRVTEDLGVRYLNGLALIRVLRDPWPGQYAELDGIYIFSRQQDARRSFVITACIETVIPRRRPLLKPQRRQK
jgi:hypothetical protein